MEQTSSPSRLQTIQQLEANIESQVIDLRHKRAKIKEGTQVQPMERELPKKKSDTLEDTAEISEMAKTLAVTASISQTAKAEPETVSKNLMDIKYRNAQRAYKTFA